MERFIDKFVEKVLSTTESFMMQSGKDGRNIRYHLYMQCNVGAARYVYGQYSYDDDTFCPKLNSKPELVAIVSNGKVYVIETYELGIWSGDTELPDNTYKMEDVVIKENDYVRDVIFPRFYESLKINPIMNVDDLDRCKKTARAILLSKADSMDNITVKDMFNKQDIANSLCGIINMKDEAMKRLTGDVDTWIYKKSFHKMVEELIKCFFY